MELLENEKILETVKGDYWEKLFLIMYSQRRGSFTLTDKRIVFEQMKTVVLDIPYENIESIKKCNVGDLVKFVPTGISIKTKEGKEYRMSVMKRAKYMELIQNKIG